MAETILALTDVAGPYTKETSTQFTTLTLAAGDATNGNKVSVARKILLLVENTAGAPGTVTVNGSPDPFGRTAPITAFSVAAGARVARFFDAVGWEGEYGGNQLSFTVSATTMKLVAIPVY
ncbi:MAG: hypothetical protein KDE45_05560 [Caldilineaceae bacterium]|nr:hypothetical protein [Caldilineaceae bacterium]